MARKAARGGIGRERRVALTMMKMERTKMMVASWVMLVRRNRCLSVRRDERLR